jgi:hypothetical protein
MKVQKKMFEMDYHLNTNLVVINIKNRLALISPFQRSIFCCLLFTFLSGSLFAQKIEAETELKYVKNSDQSKTLIYTVKFTKPGAKQSSEVVGIPVTFSVGSKKETLSAIKTNGYGVAQINIPSDQKLLSKGGEYSFYASLPEDSVFESRSDSVTLKDIFLEMNLLLKDSVKTIEINAYELGADGNKNPVKTDLNVYVPRTFSKLKIAETSTDENGFVELEFPEGIPGDSLGNLNIICRIEGHEKYATVETAANIDWGVPTNYHVSKFHRALWTTIAPYWMIVTLTVLLLGVWGHYVYVIYKLYSIRKEGKQLT